jgi:lipoprotein signal peptidase
MFTIRNMGGIALLLFGSTFIWLTPEFASRGISTSGALWSITRILSLVTLVGFTAAAWGLFQRASWWETAALASAVVGSIVLVPYWIAAHQAGETTPAFNVFIHALGNVGVFVLLLVPTLERWVTSHVMAGR